MEEALRRVPKPASSQELLQQASLLTASCTTGWLDWIHGELWLLPEGLLRIPLGLWATVINSYIPSLARRTQTHILTQHELDQLTNTKGNLWIPRKRITKANFYHGFLTDRLRLQLDDVSTVKLLWVSRDGALPVLQAVLQDWIGARLIMDE